MWPWGVFRSHSTGHSEWTSFRLKPRKEVDGLHGCCSERIVCASRLLRPRTVPSPPSTYRPVQSVHVASRPSTSRTPPSLATSLARSLSLGRGCLKKPGRPETFGWGCCKMAGRPPYRFLSTTPFENTVGQTMFRLSIFRSRNRVLERPFWRHLMIYLQIPPTRLDDAWQPSEKGLFEEAWKAPHPRKELLNETWKAQNPRKELFEELWMAQSLKMRSVGLFWGKRKLFM